MTTSTTIKDKELKINVTHKGKTFTTWSELKKYYKMRYYAK